MKQTFCMTALLAVYRFTAFVEAKSHMPIFIAVSLNDRASFQAVNARRVRRSTAYGDRGHDDSKTVDWTWVAGRKHASWT